MSESSGWSRVLRAGPGCHRCLDAEDVCMYRYVREHHEPGDGGPYSHAYTAITNFKKTAAVLEWCRPGW